jgi:formylglycine-generating enzyme required for sulfatase activity
LLRKRDQQQLLDMMYESRRLDAKETIGIEDRWYINCAGQKMIILDGGTFMMGSPESEAFRQTDEDQLSVKIDRRFAISAYEITKGQYLSYDSTFTHKELKDVSPTGVHPINGVTWHEAARYCNWLSEQAGIPQHQWCYRPVRETSERIEMEVVEGYLTKIGYRLPTEAEWEFACRAGCQDPWFFGSDPSLLGHYAWYEGHPEGGRGASAVGLLKPNMFGLFDATGNVWEWVTDDGKLRELRERVLGETAERGVDKDRVEPLLDEEYIRSPDEGPEERVRRGGSFAASHIENRAANRAPRAPSDFNRINGFRVARTIAAPVPTAGHAQ